MSRYHRPRQPGASVFFTVALAARGSALLLEQVAALRLAVQTTRAERPFHIAAWVVLPDHLHCVWTLPEGDAEYALRMAAIKARFSMAVRRSGFSPTLAVNPFGAKGGRVRVGLKPDLRGAVRGGATKLPFGKSGIGNIISAMRPPSRPACGIVGSTR